MISDDQGRELVNLARHAVRRYLEDSAVLDPPGVIGIRAGVFVTINYLTSNQEEHLRGCIGFTAPDKDISGAVIDAAISAATSDPRFPPVDVSELANVIFEVSVLTPPSEITVERKSLRDAIRIGRDGLILMWKYGSGLLLPQVPVELNWDIDQFLASICQKAGAPADALLDPSSRLYTFQAVIFKESEPSGSINRVEF